MTKKLFSIIAVLLLLSGCASTYNSGSQYTTTSDGENIDSGEGRLVFGVTDAATDIGNVNSVQLTIDKVEAHSATEGWVTLSTDEKTFDLLELKAQGKVELAADASVKAGTYDQVRLEVTRVIIVDDNGTYEAKLPSSELKVMTDFTVEEGKATATTFDFIVDESLHITGNGKYILAPVVSVETRENVDVEVDAENSVELSKGQLKQVVKVGMDEEGNVGVGVSIPADAVLSLDPRGRISIGGQGGVGIGSSAKEEGEVQSNVSIKGSLKY